MQVTVEDVSALTKRLNIIVPEQGVRKQLDKAFNKLASDVSIKGFRKGKVPRKVLEKSYGEQVHREVGDKLVQETYFDALSESKLDAVAHPEIVTHSYEDDGSFKYVAEIAVRPEFELGTYKGLEIELDELAVSDEELDSVLGNMRRAMAPLRSIEDRTVQKEDLVVIDFQGFHDGKPMPQVKAENYSVDIGTGRFGEEFENTIIGLNKDEETEREIDFPENFANPVLADKKILFKIKVKDIKERVLPELDDEFAKDAGNDYSSLNDLKEGLRKKLLDEKEEARAGDMADKLMLKLLAQHDFEVPDRLVAFEINALIKEMEDRLTNQGLTLETAGLNRDDLIEQHKEMAARRVKGDFILKRIAEEEEIKLIDEDVEKGFARISRHYQMPITEVKKYFSNRDDLLPFMNELLSEKIIHFLRDNAVITKVPAGQTDTTETKVEAEASGE
ncbi:MAG: trigger factor [Proteobacteria bacterium]|nr:trigger factor [Pseudomonadota bacterium]MBU1686789.1 trigger factor [Pseudomonadota bacterium]